MIFSNDHHLNYLIYIISKRWRPRTLFILSHLIFCWNRIITYLYITYESSQLFCYCISLTRTINKQIKSPSWMLNTSCLTNTFQGTNNDNNNSTYLIFSTISFAWISPAQNSENKHTSQSYLIIIMIKIDGRW